MPFDPKIYDDSVFCESSVYRAWLACANERDLLKVHLEQWMREWCSASRIRLLEVGCGSGATGLRLMQIADEKGVALEYTGIDPYESQLIAFREALEGRSAALHMGTLESLESGADQRWDVVFAVHSLYYVPNMVEALRKLVELGETLVVVYHGPRGINEVQEAFRDRVHIGPHIISTYNDVASAFDEIGLHYRFVNFCSSVDVSSCKDARSPVGRNLMRFFLERTDLDDTDFEKLALWFRDRPDTMIHDVGLFFVHSGTPR